MGLAEKGTHNISKSQLFKKMMYLQKYNYSGF